MNDDAFKKLILILILFSIGVVFQVNSWYQDRQLDKIRTQIASKQDEIRSLNIILSNQKNDITVMQEAERLQFRKIQPGESEIIENESITESKTN